MPRGPGAAWDEGGGRPRKKKKPKSCPDDRVRDGGIENLVGGEWELSEKGFFTKYGGYRVLSRVPEKNFPAVRGDCRRGNWSYELQLPEKGKAEGGRGISNDGNLLPKMGRVNKGGKMRAPIRNPGQGTKGGTGRGKKQKGTLPWRDPIKRRRKNRRIGAATGTGKGPQVDPKGGSGGGEASGELGEINQRLKQ